MGAISTIRKHYGLVVGLIGLAIAAFILTDVLSPEGGTLVTPDDTVAKIGEEEIAYNNYQDRLQVARENHIQQTGEARMSATEQVQLENEVWRELIEEIVMNKELDDIQLEVTEAELIEMVNPDDPHPVVRELLTDPTTGRFESEQLRQLLNAAGQDPRARGQLLQLEDALTQAQVQNKYLNLVEKSFYTTNLEARDDFFNRNRTADVDFIGIETDVIDDEQVEVTRADMENYYQNNRDRFEREEERDIRYVTYDVNPSPSDSLEVREWIEDQKGPFSETDDDSSFVDINSDREIFPSVRDLGEIDEPVQDEILDAEPSDVLGPYLYEGDYNITKLISTEDKEDYTLRSRHIFIEEAEEDAEELANDLLDRIRGGEDFGELALEFGMDEFAFDEGDLGWFREGSHPEALEEAIIDNPVGELTLVESEQGYHVLEVTHDPVQQRFETATVSRRIVPSSETFSNVYDDAFDFSTDAHDPETFEEAAEEYNLNISEATNIERNDQIIPGIGPARELVGWMYESNEGEVSEVFEIREQYVVALLADTREEGYQELDEVETEVRNIVREERKKEEIARLLREERDAGANLQSMSVEFNTDLITESGLAFIEDNISGFGRQQGFIGGVFGIPSGVISHPLKGDQAVFMAEISSFADVELPEDLKDIREERNQERGRYAMENAMEKLREMTTVEDNRYQFH